MTVASITSILERMTQLLENTSSTEWLKPLGELKLNVLGDEKGTARDILRLYGGTGSLNDIILYKGTELLVAETTEFSVLRKELFEKCKTAL